MPSVSARITGAFAVRECPGESRGGRQCVELMEPLEYRVGSDDSDERITVPAGFVTDFASIPWGLHNLFPPMGRWSRPAIIHDFLYATAGDGIYGARKYTTRDAYSRAEADAIFREAMKVVGVPAWRREVMYSAVRFGGRKGWGT